ncbi:MAG: DUF169 domain-containing protein [Proteobacteria bacterium]|nr:DUF169 domain-containing protein [Pseudomonadota bacterium]MBU4471342.1 DUF169 domain-containing protein [Pseudomonadota bacterium]MCG2751655.1 DUF169 domain-containing protein [Desulfobacteraceae bacterium]
MMDLKQAAGTIEKYLRVHTRPIALKYFEKSEELPQNIRRPGMLGVKMAFCQINTIVRKWGWSFAVGPEDINCVAALMSFGWGDLDENLDKTEELINFRINAGYIKDRKTAIHNMEKTASLMNEKKFSAKGLVVSPLDSGTVENPDVILIYGNPAQMARMVQAMIYSEGGVIESWANMGASCVREMIAPLIENKAGYVIPGRGARQLGMAGDDEMVFTLPAKKLDSLLEGLKETHEKGTKYPINQFLFFEPMFNKTVEKLREKIKLNP